VEARAVGIGGWASKSSDRKERGATRTLPSSPRVRKKRLGVLKSREGRYGEGRHKKTSKNSKVSRNVFWAKNGKGNVSNQALGLKGRNAGDSPNRGKEGSFILLEKRETTGSAEEQATETSGISIEWHILHLLRGRGKEVLRGEDSKQEQKHALTS